MFESVSYLKFNVYTISGFMGIFLMYIHTVWATKILVRNDEKAISNFHSFSIKVWCVWIVSFVSGVVIAIRNFSSG